MEWWQAIILGIVQGLTEFLPVSSSGHLMIFKEILGADGEGFLDFTVAVHFAQANNRARKQGEIEKVTLRGIKGNLSWHKR